MPRLEELGFSRTHRREETQNIFDESLTLPIDVRKDIPQGSIDNESIDKLNVRKLLAGSLLIGEYIQSTGFVAGTSGWQIKGDGSAQFKDIILTGGTISYGKTSFTDSVNAGYYISSAGIYAGAAADSNYLKYDIAGATFTLYGMTVTAPVITAIANGSDLAFQSWSFPSVFSASDYCTVAWTAVTLTFGNGVTYAISAGNTGSMSALSYIYFDRSVSTTVLQVATSFTTSANKVLIAVATPNSDTTAKAQFLSYGQRGDRTLLVDNLVANSASTNEFISNTAQIKDLVVSNAKIISASVDKLTSGSITSKQIDLTFTDTVGDVYIGCGSYNATTWTATGGFLMGIDDSDSNKVKFYMGDATSWWDWNVTTANRLTISGDIAVGSLPQLPPDTYLAGYWAFNENSGTIAYDNSKNGNNGTAVNCTIVPGLVGNALSFNGSTSYMVVTDNSDFQNIFDGVGGSVSVPIYPNSDGELNTGQIINKANDTTGEGGWLLRVDSEAAGYVKITFIKGFSGTNGSWSTTTLPVAILAWSNIVVTYSASATTNDPIIYVNGVSIALTENTTPTGTSGSDVGNDFFVGSDGGRDAVFDGIIGGVRIYKGYLISANEAKALYLNPAGSGLTLISPTGITTQDLTAISAFIKGSLEISTAGNIKSGQTAYGTGTGFFFEYNAGTPRASIGVGTTGFTFDGTTGYLNNRPIATVQDRAERLYTSVEFLGSKNDGLSVVTSGSGAVTRNICNTSIDSGDSEARLLSGVLATTGAGADVGFSKNMEFNITASFPTIGASSGACLGISVNAGYPQGRTDGTNRRCIFLVEGTTIYANTANGTNAESTDTGITANSTKRHFRIVFTSGTSALYYIDDVLVATHTTYLPSGTTASIIKMYANEAYSGAGGTNQAEMLINNNYSLLISL